MFKNTLYDIVVVGGGAAGLFCALSAKRKNPDLKILIVEKRDKPARKLLMSGNGRCNIGNTAIYYDSYNDSETAITVIQKATKEKTYVELLRAYGIDTHEIGSKMATDSWLYPLTQQSKTVAETILKQLEYYETEFLFGWECSGIISEVKDKSIQTNKEIKNTINSCRNDDDYSRLIKSDEGFLYKIKLIKCEKSKENKGHLSTERGIAEKNDKVEIYAKKVVFAMGSAAWGGEKSEKILDSLEIKYEPFSPVLCGLYVDPEDVKYLAGERLSVSIERENEMVVLKNCKVNVDEVKSETVVSINNRTDDTSVKHTEYLQHRSSEKTLGEIIIKADSVNGICIMQLSRYVGDGDNLFVDFMPYFSKEELTLIFQNRLSNKDVFYRENGFYNLDNLYLGIMTESVFRAAKEKLNREKKTINVFNLVLAIKRYKIKIKGKFSEKEAQVMRGGVLKSELDENMMLKRREGLYVVGEMTNIDGDCGGYNLMYAISSGILVGEAAASTIAK